MQAMSQNKLALDQGSNQGAEQDDSKEQFEELNSAFPRRDQE